MYYYTWSKKMEFVSNLRGETAAISYTAVSENSPTLSGKKARWLGLTSLTPPTPTSRSRQFYTFRRYTECFR